jgi:hypothetical protein
MINKIPQDDLTVKIMGDDGLPKWAVLLPAISRFFTGYIGRQRYMTRGHIPAERIRPELENGVEGFNWMNKEKGYFYYRDNLFSAGHAELNPKKRTIIESMIYERDRKNSWLLGDSGGYQIGKGVWMADWKNSTCPAAATKRKEVLEWMDRYMDYGMILDIPAWVRKTERGRQSSGITSFDDAIEATSINNEYFMRNKTGACKFLNVMQGGNHKESDDWYNRMKKFCDPKQYAEPFNGWACGSQIACDPHLTLKRLITARFDGLLEKGIHDRIHILGQSDIEWALLLSDIQRAIRKYQNPNMIITYDCSSPFLCTYFGMIYYGTFNPEDYFWNFLILNKAKVTRKKRRCVFDNKKYASDQRGVGEAYVQDGVCPSWLDSPISKRVKVNDICHIGPGQPNKLGRIGATSWDSFSYPIQVSHNVWTHIEAVQEANRQYDAGQFPAVMSTVTSTKNGVLYYDRLYCKDIIDEIWATSDYGKAMKLIDHYSRYWMHFRGVRGNVGKYTKNSTTAFDHIFQEV